MKPLILFHASCTDGYAAAYAAWECFGDEAEYVPMHYGPEPLKNLLYKGRDVYILDFSLPMSDTYMLAADAASLTWLDHHKTAFEMWCPDGEREFFHQEENNGQCDIYITLDNNNSGARLAWDFFHPDTPPPMVIKHIDDRDRWQFKMRGSREIHLALQSEQPWTFEK